MDSYLRRHSRPVVAEHLPQRTADLPQSRLGLDRRHDGGHRILLSSGRLDDPCQRCVVPTRSPGTGERYADFAAIFEKQRYAKLPYWATRSRFDHFYRLAANTRPVAGHSGVIRVGDDVQIP